MDVCVTDLVGYCSPVEGTMCQVLVDGTVKDDLGNPIAGVEVSGEAEGFAGEPGFTDAAGMFTVYIEKIEIQNLPEVVFSVTDVVPADLWYTYTVGAGCIEEITINNPSVP